MKSAFKISALSLALTLAACGGGSSSNDPASQTPLNSLTITAVDPYIEDAEFYVDINNNGVYDTGTDKLSQAGSTAGQYVFANYTPSSDVTIRAKSNGKHNGIDFKIGLQGAAPSGSTAVIINPATTLTSKLSISNAELVTILNQFSTDLGMVVSEADITSDPVAGILEKSIEELTDADIAKVRLQVTLTGLQRIMRGSEVIQALTSTQFIASATLGANDGDANDVIYNIFSGLISAVKSGVNKSNITGFTNDSGYQTILSYGAPTIKANQLFKTAITIMNRITEAGYSACNSYNQGVTVQTWSATDNLNAINNAINPLVNQINGWGAALGPMYYAADNQATISALSGGSQIISQMRASTDLSAGFDCASKYFEVNTSNQVTCVQ